MRCRALSRALKARAQGSLAGWLGVTPVRSSSTVNDSGRDGRNDWTTASATIVCRAQQPQS